jgi:hypothetical protein
MQQADRQQQESSLGSESPAFQNVKRLPIAHLRGTERIVSAHAAFGYWAMGTLESGTGTESPDLLPLTFLIMLMQRRTASRDRYSCRTDRELR